ncbi:7-cyano-7-deazaguanine synthase [Streptomyces javensis]|uniref:7-cyano-7-deazaguanine synthase n=1 Tax=Streptomyces javensis TaxID=114698 RepID=UPI0033E1FAB2
MARIIAIVSGGLDSVVLAYHLQAQGHDLRMLSVDYGQRHRKEHDYAELAAKRLSTPHDVLDLRQMATLLPGYSLTDDQVDVPDRYYTAPGSVNVIPNRNVILLSVAYAAAAAARADQVAIGTVAGDSPAASDCSPEFIASFNAMEVIACADYAPEGLRVVAPFVELPKHEVIRLGEELKVPWQETWSCYKGLAEQCGTCGACQDRRKAFDLAGVPDPTVYVKG